MARIELAEALSLGEINRVAVAVAGAVEAGGFTECLRCSQGGTFLEAHALADQPAGDKARRNWKLGPRGNRPGIRIGPVRVTAQTPN